MFPGITTEVCATAWLMVTPAIEKAFALSVTDGLRGTILVIDPASVTHEVLFTGHVGEPQDPYLEYATGKAKVTARTGMDSSRVRQDFPHLYIEGDIKYPGAILRDGIVVAFSGVQGVFDEMICEWMVSAIRALCRDQFQRPGGADEQPGPYLTR
jgi:hypothetical protein